MFSGFLKIADGCPHCGTSFKGADTGDGPAVFVILIGGTIAAVPVIYASIATNWPPLLIAALGLPLALGVTLGLLRPAKGLLFAYQVHHKAAPGTAATLDEDGDGA